MQINKAKVGSVYRRKVANGMTMTVTIKAEPTQKEIDLYKMLGLDVFTDITISKKLVPVDFENMKMGELREYAKGFGVKGRSKQDIIDALREKRDQ